MDMFLMTASLALAGIIAGIYVSGVIHDFRIDDLTAGQYMAMHQMRDRTFTRVMPVVRLTTLVLIAAPAMFAVDAGLPRILTIVAAALVVIDIGFTVSRQVPLNKQVQSWTPVTIPDDWAQTRDSWAANHNLRLVLGLAEYACLFAAVILTLSR
ncbi:MULTISPECIES: DUF1772 domain-containing protein [unclassified Mesorhizobium]|uniref:DUF1772 domain-containing protein n=1 Tax=unclassified Mesorhizobium TaxID=325217 RepID=UPI00333A12E2